MDALRQANAVYRVVQLPCDASLISEGWQEEEIELPSDRAKQQSSGSSSSHQARGDSVVGDLVKDFTVAELNRSLQDLQEERRKRKNLEKRVVQLETQVSHLSMFSDQTDVQPVSGSTNAFTPNRS
jgi:hypothetical protein